jgi:hypothetical protein
MNAFATLVADFAEKTGVEPGKLGADNFDVEADGVVVSAQYRADRDDCVNVILFRQFRRNLRGMAGPLGQKYLVPDILLFHQLLEPVHRLQSKPRPSRRIHNKCPVDWKAP